MAGNSEIEDTMETMKKLQDFKNVPSECCDQLIDAANGIIQKINENRKTIDLLVEEIKNNESIIEEHKQRSVVNYEVDEDGFINVASKKRNLK